MKRFLTQVAEFSSVKTARPSRVRGYAVPDHRGLPGGDLRARQASAFDSVGQTIAAS